MSKITYNNKVENNGATAEGRASAANLNEIKASVNALYDSTPLTYIARCFNSNGPGDTVVFNAQVLFNNTGIDFSPSRLGLGIYALTASSTIDFNKIMVTFTKEKPQDNVCMGFVELGGLNRVVLKTYGYNKELTPPDFEFQDFQLNDLVKIEIYP